MTAKIINLDDIQPVDINKKILEQTYILEKYEDNYQSIFQSVKIDTWEQLEWLFKETFNQQKNGYYIFRGQKNCHWKLISSLERETKNKSIIEDYFNLFREKSRGKIKEQLLLKKSLETEDIRELWAVGQHMGLKTPLLDWTKSLFVSLFFAFEDKENNSPYRAIFCIDANVLDMGEMYVGDIFEPISDPYGRLTAQKGLFMTNQVIPKLQKYMNRDSTITNIKIARKYFITNKLREEVLEYLKFLGIELETIYPDLEGVIKAINKELELKIKKPHLSN